jgi:hypothetical protein
MVAAMVEHACKEPQLAREGMGGHGQLLTQWLLGSGALSARN